MENELYTDIEVQFSWILKITSAESTGIFMQTKKSLNIVLEYPCIFHSNISRLFNEFSEFTEFIEIVNKNRKNWNVKCGFPLFETRCLSLGENCALAANQQ